MGLKNEEIRRASVEEIVEEQRRQGHGGGSGAVERDRYHVIPSAARHGYQRRGVHCPNL